MAEPPTPPSARLHELSRDELIKYVELHLWDRFQERLDKRVAVFFALIALATLLGGPYYISTQLDRRLEEQRQEFGHRLNETISHAKLLSLESTRYNEARHQLRNDLMNVVVALDFLKARLAAADPSDKRAVTDADVLISNLLRISALDEHSVADVSLLLPTAFMKEETLLPPTYVASTSDTPFGGGKNAVYWVHPMRDGSLLGALQDIRFRVIELEAYRRALQDVASRLGALGGKSPLEASQSLVALRVLHADAFSRGYERYREELAAEVLLDSKSRQGWSDLRSLYSLDHEIFPAQSEGRPGTPRRPASESAEDPDK